MNETIENALRREILEETNLTIESFEFLFSIPNTYLYSNLEIFTADMFFKSVVTNLEPMKAQDDVADLFFISKKELNPDDFGMASVRQAIKKML